MLISYSFPIVIVVSAQEACQGYTLILFITHVTIQSSAKMFGSQSHNIFFKSAMEVF